MNAPRKSIFVAGNGPSLKELDFGLLRGMDWLGMNAAYRYWDRVGVYPTLYCCLDKVLIRSHAREILRLHAQGQVERFFLVRDILEEIPDFPQDDRVFFLEDMAASEAPGAEIFHTAFGDKKTTGSWAVRFAIFQGYRDIILGGIDCSYVEVIREAAATGVGLELKIASRVASNPNYFFDDYQRQGDTYQVPNPAQHFGNLHLQSFEALNHDIARLGLGVRIRNTARSSQLHRFGVYEHLPLADALGEPALQAVAVPLVAAELPQLLDALSLWDEPAFLPLRPDSPLRGRIDLRLFFDGEPTDAVVDAIQQAWARLPGARACFRRLEITFLGIPADLNRYIRDPKRRDAPRKLGPNLHFLAMMRECRGYRFTQLMETDCVPAKADWLTDLDAICRMREPFWIAGACLQDLGPVSPALAQHINGNALYATGDPGFQAFVEDTFTPALRHLILDRGDIDLAYDCLVAKLAGEVAAEDPTLRGYAAAVQRNLHRFRPLSAIANLSVHEAAMDEADLLEELEGDRVLVHSRRLAKLLARGRAEARGTLFPEIEHRALERRFHDTFLKIPAGVIHAVRCYANRPGCTLQRFDRARGTAVLDFDEASGAVASREQGAFMLFGTQGETRGRQLQCRVEVLSATRQRLLLKFARHGEGAFVEDAVEVDVQPASATSLCLRIDCPDDYAQVRLFVTPVAGAQGRIQVCAVVSEPAMDEATGGVSIRHVADADGLRGLFGSFRKRTPGALLPLRDARAAGLPRLLMIDSTALGHGSATGQLKKVFLEGWPEEAFLQVWLDGRTPRLLRPGQRGARKGAPARPIEDIVRHCVAFKPDVVYFRPIDAPELFEVATRVRERIEAPFVIHMMDDWPTRMARRDPERHALLDDALRGMVAGASRLLAIGDAMARAYDARYGGRWLPLANGADADRYPPLPRPERDPSRPFVLRYMGGLADDMTYASVCDVARAVSSLSTRLPVRMDIHTMDWYRNKAERELGHLPGVAIAPLVPDDLYEQALGSADALLIAYNFDPDSIDYIGLSLANKMPECLASGAPVLAYGPEAVATIAYLADAGVAEVVRSRDPGLLQAAIERLVTDEAHCGRLAEAARRHVRTELTLGQSRERFRAVMREAWAFGPFRRESAARCDETGVVSALLDVPAGSVLVDVGARDGHALAVLERGWRVLAFESDAETRARMQGLVEKIDPSRVRIDPRSVDGRARGSVLPPGDGVPADAADAAREERTTLAEALAGEDCARVEFLRVGGGVDGLSVLEGFPWDRSHPAVVACAFDNAQAGRHHHDIARFLQAHGYDVRISAWHPVTRPGTPHDWRGLAGYPCELADDAWGSVLALRDPVPDSGLAAILQGLVRVRVLEEIGQHEESALVPAPRRFRVVADPAFHRLARTLWRYRQGEGASRAHWMAIVDEPGETAGRTFAGSLRLRTSVPITVKASLARLGGAPYEGSVRRIALTPNEDHEVRFCVRFEGDHPALKLQVYVEGMPAGMHGDLSIDPICLGEIPEALAEAHLAGTLDFRMANRLLREGRVADALAVYRLLFGGHPLRIYRDNIQTAQALLERA